MDHDTVEVEPDNYFNPGTPVADFRVDSNGVVEILTERAPLRAARPSLGGLFADHHARR